MKSRFGIFLVLMIVGVLPAAAQTEDEHRPMMRDGDHRPMMGGGDHERSMMSRLKLTDQQQADLRKLRIEMEKGMVKVEASIKLARIDLQQLVTAENPDRSAVEKKIREISDLQLQAKMVAVNHLFDVNAKLTTEQQKIFKAQIVSRLTEATRHRMMERGAGRPGMGDHHGMMER